MTLTTAPRLRAHLLVQADPGTAPQLVRYLTRVPGIVEASSTDGPYDAVAHVEVEDEEALRRVLRASRAAPGLARLCLCRPQQV